MSAVRYKHRPVAVSLMIKHMIAMALLALLIDKHASTGSQSGRKDLFETSSHGQLILPYVL